MPFAIAARSWGCGLADHGIGSMAASTLTTRRGIVGTKSDPRPYLAPIARDTCIGTIRSSSENALLTSLHSNISNFGNHDSYHLLSSNLNGFIKRHRTWVLFGLRRHQASAWLQLPVCKTSADDKIPTELKKSCILAARHLDSIPVASLSCRSNYNKKFTKSK